MFATSVYSENPNLKTFLLKNYLYTDNTFKGILLITYKKKDERRKLTQICNTIDAITSANTNVIYVYYKTMQRAQRDKGMKTDDVTIPHNVGSCITMMYLFLGVSALFFYL